jgi:hypothetical protein
MQLFPAPTDHSARPSVWSVLDAVEEPPLGFHRIRIPIHNLAYGFGHQAGHRLVPGSGVDSEAAEEGIWQAERDVLVGLAIHSFQCIT